MTQKIIISTIISAIVLIFILIIGHGCLTKRKHDAIINKIKNVELGMSMADVNNIMGEPLRKSETLLDSIPIETWYYYSAPAASTAPQITFDKTNSRVILIIGSNTYRLFDQNYNK